MSGHLRILAVEDDQDLAELYESFLSWEGHDVLLAHNGDEALRLLRQRPDVILLDLRLPDTDGGVLLRRLRREPGARHTPVIVVSATVPSESRIRDADAVVSKPFDISELLGTIYRVARQPHRAPHALHVMH
jgi:two-component system phosphate regulon response regulator PhoB